MRRILWGAAVLGTVGAATLASLVVWPVGAAPGPIALSGDVDRGAYLARVSGCISCHSNFEAARAPWRAARRWIRRLARSTHRT